ncbi:MAG: hypothetical protein ACRENQ_10520 [Gemmatimonadaceae bacterium]
MSSSVPNTPHPTTHQSKTTPESRSPVERLRYSPPHLTQYGRVDEITEAVGRRGRTDSHGRGGGGRNRRTGF